MTRRIVRTFIQLLTITVVVILAIFFLDSRFRVLPPSIHDYLPQHHAGLVITDITVTRCTSTNVLSSCNVEGDGWHRIEKDLYLGSAWFSEAFVHIQRKKEGELSFNDRVVLDLVISRHDPSHTKAVESQEQWESRPEGIWIKRSAKPHASDDKKAVTGIDVLFGADAVDPREGWEIKDLSLFLGGSGEVHQPRLSIRRGAHSNPPKPVPQIRENGKFKILQVADLHLSTGLGICRDAVPNSFRGGKCDADPRTFEFIGKILDEEKPDLVVLSGDQIDGGNSPDAQTAIFKYADLFIRRKIPYATIFGNHDDEGRALSRLAQMALIETLPYSLSEAGPPGVDGVGNYVVEILARGGSKHSALSLYLLDTHAYSPDEQHYPGYDWIKQSQIDWFNNKAEGLQKEHEKYTHHHMDLAFIHIPLPEYRDPDNIIVGTGNETVTAPVFNSGFRDALIKQGVLLVSCGHDHINEYCALSEEKSAHDILEPKLWMCYGGGSGFGGYGGYGGYHRRVRLFDIDMNEARITTYKRLEYGETEKRIDEQDLVQGGRLHVTEGLTAGN